MQTTIRQSWDTGLSSPACSARMGIKAITHGERWAPRGLPDDLPSISLPKPYMHPQTPPASASGSPRLTIEGSSLSPKTRPVLLPMPTIGSHAKALRDCSPLPSIARQDARLDTSSKPLVRLPSLEEFDLGVEALARSFGPARPYTPPSPLPGLRRSSALPQLLPVMRGYTHDSLSPYQMNDAYMSSALHLDGYSSPPPDGENRHINQKYTIEEGDFIIYAWHDRKLKWQRIKHDFAAMFGRTPERTVQGLQAWYYRMNQRIPLWDREGWLIYDNEDDMEPKYVSIKCRERDSQDKPMEPLGLAQRYPERAIKYSWVDPELKRKAQDWATKRIMQHRDRRERRKRKEMRRLRM